LKAGNFETQSGTKDRDPHWASILGVPGRKTVRGGVKPKGGSTSKREEPVSRAQSAGRRIGG